MLCFHVFQMGAGFQKLDSESGSEHPSDTPKNQRLGKSTYQESAIEEISRIVMEFVH